MAKEKNKPEDPEITRVDAGGDQKSPDDATKAGPSAEDRLAALELENEQLRSQLAAKNAPPPAAAPVASEPARRFLVKVQDAPAWVVEAADEANAFAAYKKATSIIATPHTPEVKPTNLPVGRFRG